MNQENRSRENKLALRKAQINVNKWYLDRVKAGDNVTKEDIIARMKEELELNDRL